MRYKIEITDEFGQKDNILLKADSLEIAIRTIQRSFPSFYEARFYEEQYEYQESGSWKFVGNATPLTVSEDDFDEWATETFDISDDISLKEEEEEEEEDKKNTPLQYITKILLGLFLGILFLYLFFVAAYIGAGKYVVILILIFGILYLIRGLFIGSDDDDGKVT